MLEGQFNSIIVFSQQDWAHAGLLQLAEHLIGQ
jgi:hypothetical protein